MSEVEKFHSRGSGLGASMTKFSPTGEKAMLTDCLKEESIKWTMQIVSPKSNCLTTLRLGCHLAIFTSSKFQQIVHTMLPNPYQLNKIDRPTQQRETEVND